MRIGFDASQTGHGKAGCGYYAHGLIHALIAQDRENQYIVYPTFGDHFYDPEIQCDELADISNVQLGSHHQHAQAKDFWGRPGPNFENDLGNPDIVHANNFFAPRGLMQVRLVYTLYDLGFLENWSWTTEVNRTGCFEGVFRASVLADWLIAISQFSKERFLEMFPHYPPDRISVVYPASRFRNGDPETEPTSVKLQPREFWLAVGTVEPRKNYGAILSAYAKLRAQVGPATYPLIIAGGAGWMMDIQATIQKLNLGDSVALLGYTEDAVLAWLYRNATCLLFPSFYEGFGMPVLEAMSCGTPVIASKTSAMPEIIGNGELARYLVDPTDPASLYSTMHFVHNMARDDIERVGRLAQKRAQEFSWNRSARSLLEIYRQVASIPKLFGQPAQTL